MSVAVAVAVAVAVVVVVVVAVLLSGTVKERKTKDSIFSVIIDLLTEDVIS